MCSCEAKVTTGLEPVDTAMVKINGRAVLQPSACNRAPSFDRSNSLKKSTPPTHPVRESAVVVSKGNSVRTLERKKSKSFKEGGMNGNGETGDRWSLIMESPGSIAAVRREQVAQEQALRKMKIAHYGRSKSAKFESAVLPPLLNPFPHLKDEKRSCSFITPNSDPIYVAYHDEEWGVPVHDDKMLFELLVLSGAQVGSDWTSILRKRQDFRKALWEFEAEEVAKLNEKQINAISWEYKIDISRVRGVVDNARNIVEIKKEMGSFEKYIWGFVNHKPIATNYKLGHKMGVKTSKSECISKDMVRRGFRFVGPTVVHSFMQAAGLTNDHLVSCHRHLPISLLS